MADKYKFYAKNKRGRDFVVGDIHGMYTLLMEHLWELDFDFKKDRLFSVGDLVDRGPEPIEVLRLLTTKWFYPVMGNHDEMFSSDDQAYYLANYGAWTFREDPEELDQFKALVSELPVAIEVETSNKKIGIVHAEPGADWEYVRLGLIDFECTIWSRHRALSSDAENVKNIDAVVVGHTPMAQPKVLGNVHFIDTAAFHPKGSLTIVNLEDI